MSTQHARFQARLIDSRPAVEAVAAWLRRKYVLTVPEFEVAPSADVACFYVDGGDIILADGRIIEVKGLNYDFLPWPFRQAFVTSVAAHERHPDVLAHVFLNPSLTCAGIVLGSTRERWYLVNKNNSNTGNVERGYACPLDCVIWRRLT